MKRLFISFISFIIVISAYYIITLIISNPLNYKTVGDISAPIGYKKVDSDFSNYSRTLPLKDRGSKVKLQNTNRNANLQFLNYAVIDMPLLHPREDCADVVLHLHKEYLLTSHNVPYNKSSVVNQMVNQFNTSTIRYTANKVDINDLQPGDVFAYSSPGKGAMGHTVTILDVAVNKSGKKMFLIAEGNMPGRSIHLMRNLWQFNSAWFSLEDGKIIRYFPKLIQPFVKHDVFNRYNKDCILISVWAFDKTDIFRFL